MTTLTAYTWHSDSLAAATNGSWHQLSKPISSTNIITDTRKIGAGDVFLAIRGDKFDAHDFVQTAKDAGAVAAIVERVVACDIPQLVVADSKLALGDLGRYRRDAHPDLTVVALTGSSGKTTTKEMIGAILGQLAPTLMTHGNLNNDLGVPMMLLRLSDEHRFAVMELGANHLGEIAYTASMVRPDVACVLNIGTAHLGEFGGRENIARAKSEIYTALSQDGVAVLPFGDEFVDLLANEAGKFTQKQLSFGERLVGLDEADLTQEDRQMLSQEGVEQVLLMGDVFADDAECLATHSTFSLNIQDDDKIQSALIKLPFIGEHNINNALAAATACHALGVSIEQIKSGLEQAVAPKGRLTRLSFGEHTLIDDTYNANPTSMIAAAKVLEGEMGQKILVLGDIFELGDAADDEHFKLGEALATLALDAVLTVGKHMEQTAIAINQTRPIAKHFADKAALFAHLTQLLNQQSTVLFKGSRGMQMESLIADLTKDKE